MRIKDKFLALKEKNEAALIIYLTGGFPTIEKSMENIRKIANAGADIIEVGIPFSDPIADGETIQYSSNVAISNGATIEKIIDSFEEFRIGIPLVLMSYINPLIAYGKERLFKRLKEVGISGLIIPDLPVEESEEWRELSRRFELDLIFLVAPTSSEERIKKIAEYSGGFLYCVSVKGTTGERDKLPEDTEEYIQRVKKLTHKPVAFGFGISNEEQIAALKGKVEGIIVGSRIIKGIKENENVVNLIKKFKSITR